MNKYRPTIANIDLGALRFNYQQIKKLSGAKVKVLAAVKANAYGHGMEEVSRALIRCGVDYLGVASVDEAMFLREKKIKSPILVLGAVFSQEEVRLAQKHDITLTAADLNMAKLISRALGKNKIKVHIKIDTGMGRLGIWHEQAESEIIRICGLKNIFTEGIYTHFASADTNRDFTIEQIRRFKELIAGLSARGIDFPLRHAANSIGACCFPHPFLNMVRPGIMLYGMYPGPGLKKIARLKPVLCLETKICYLKTVASGRSISYGQTYIAKKNTRIANLPIGYADGYPRALSNKAEVLISGKKFPVVGRVCMDQTMIDVGFSPKIKLGSKVTLIGAQGQENISAEDIARLCQTIPYEITCGISSRVRRVFKNY